MEICVFRRSGRADPAVTAVPAFPKESLPAGWLACRCVFTPVITQLGWQSPREHYLGKDTLLRPQPHNSPVLCHTCATLGALPFTGRVLCATAARWLKWKTQGECWEQASLLTRGELWATKSSRTGRATTAACQRLISTWLRDGMVFLSLYIIRARHQHLHACKITPNQSIPDTFPPKKPPKPKPKWKQTNHTHTKTRTGLERSSKACPVIPKVWDSLCNFP